MGNGRRAKAPCGHLGEVVIGTYVQCPRCDKAAVPKHIDPEKTEPMWDAKCPGCGSGFVKEFEDDLDAAFWLISNYPAGGLMTPNVGEWGCSGCGKVFTKPT